MDLGTAIKARRTGRNLTLEMLAQRSGVSRAMLSEIERGVKNPTVKIALQIAGGLDCTLTELLGEPASQAPEPRPAEVIRRGQQRILVDSQTGVERHQIAPALLARGIEICWFVLPGNGTTGPLPRRPFGAEIHLTVIWGAIRCRVADQEETLGQGDSINFPANVPHEIENPETDFAHFFWVLDAG